MTYKQDEKAERWWYVCNDPDCKNHSRKEDINIMPGDLRGWNVRGYRGVHLCEECRRQYISEGWERVLAKQQSKGQVLKSSAVKMDPEGHIPQTGEAIKTIVTGGNMPDVVNQVIGEQKMAGERMKNCQASAEPGSGYDPDTHGQKPGGIPSGGTA